ncbi:MAG: acyl-CoA thioesterase-1 [Motiliproteus sp.]|jgi:acyl-CoA thioesterase-1
MRVLVWVLALVLTTASVTTLAANEVQGSSKNRPSPVLLVLGDSISAGYGLEPQQGWVSLLQRRLAAQDSQFSVINASISGDTTNGGLSRLPRLLQEYRPQILLIELGANDGLRGAPLQLIEANLKRLIKQGQQAGAQVLLLGMRIPPNYGSRYSEGFFELFGTAAADAGIDYLPFLLEGVGGVSALMQSDGLHPNQQAQQRLLDNSWVVLEPLLSSPSSD